MSTHARFLALLLTFAPLAVHAQEDRAEQLIEVLRSGKPDARARALSELADMGPSALPAVRRAFAASDPDLRFDLLFLLHEPDGRMDKLVRVIVASEDSNSASYPEAVDAYEEILAKARVDTLNMVLRMVLRKAKRTGDNRDRFIGVGLCLARDLIKASPPGLAVGPEHAKQLAKLLEVDLKVGFHDLAEAFAALPPDLALGALGPPLSGGTPIVRARAARIIGEITTPASAPVAAGLLAPLLQQGDSRVRLAALQAYELLPLADRQAFLPVVKLAKDPKDAVALTALRLCGARGLAAVSDAAEIVAANPERPMALRREALRALGSTRTGSEELLVRMADPKREPRELAVLAAWALGCGRSARAEEVLLGLIRTDGFAQENMLYRGLARIGGERGCAALLGLLARPTNGERPQRLIRARAIEALGHCSDAPQAAEALGRIAGANPVANVSMPGVTGPEIVAALEALAERGDELGRAQLAEQLLTPRRRRQLDMTIPLLLRAGPPRSRPELVRRLTELLTSLSSRGMSGFDRYHALVKVSPERARTVLSMQLRRHHRADHRSRELARALARAGDPSKIDSLALPLSRRRLAEAPQADRDNQLNDIGIDLLYARRIDEALMIFQRMLWCTPRDDVAAYNMACSHSLAGRKEPALRYLRRSIETGYKKHRHIASDADFEPLHGELRFQRLVERLRLSEETEIKFSLHGWPRGE